MRTQRTNGTDHKEMNDMKTRDGRSWSWPTRLKLIVVIVLGSSLGALAVMPSPELGVVGQTEEPQAEHITQEEINDLVIQGGTIAFDESFEVGDELFETVFNMLDGVGANVGQGQRFTRFPRADLSGPGEWATHIPQRATGPNAQSCDACHNQPFGDGAGAAMANAIRDPFHTGNVGSFINRNAPHVFGIGGLQRLAEEMTEELHAIRDQAIAEAAAAGSNATKRLLAKGVDFGFITARANGSVDTIGVEGVDADLVIRSLQWKGSVASIRDFVRGAAHNELGMQAVEITGDDVDGDGDGVANELTIGDITALTVYQAGQPRPTTRVELAALGLIEPLSASEVAAINQGEQVFEAIGCATCHTPSLTINNPIFSEPSQNANYRDALFPTGQDPIARGLNPAIAVTFDLTKDLPDNRIAMANGSVFNLGSFEKDAQGRALIRLFGDLKRHDMGSRLAESIDEVGTGASVWITKELWGVGSTAPYLHDGRATTLTEAILEHGGEAARTRASFLTLLDDDKKALITFLNNLVLFKVEEEG